MKELHCDGAFRGVHDTYSQETDLTSVGESEEPGTSLWASASWPNPFNASATISFVVGGDPARRTQVLLRIFSASGRTVRTLVNEIHPAGRQTVQWTGTDDNGVEVPAGIYFYQVEADSERAQGKIVVVR